MKKLFLLDAYALLFRSYYAFINSPRINSKGMNTSAILGFVNTLQEVLSHESPTHIGVAMDSQGPTFRHVAYPDYKAQRESTPEDIKASVPWLRRILKAHGIPLYEMQGFEADDIIGTATFLLDDGDTDIYMMTPDKDYAQLVRPRVSMYRPGKGNHPAETLGVEEVKARYGISDCRQVIDLLALMGDSADNIKGCPGVGEKTATKLVQEYGSVEGVLANAASLKGQLREKVEQNAEQIRMSKWLVTIKTDLPLDIKTEALRLREPDQESLRKIYEELEFRNLLRRIKPEPAASEPYAGDLFSSAGLQAVSATKQGNAFEGLHSMSDLAPTYRLASTPQERQELLSHLLSQPLVSIDTETTSTDAMSARLVGLSFACQPGEAWYVPAPSPAVAQEFRPLYESEAITKVGQNLKYDINVLANIGINVQGPMFDTMIAHYLTCPDQPHSLDNIAETLLAYKTIHIEELIGPKGKKQRSMADLAPADIRDYACEDADIALRLKEPLEQEMKEKGVLSLFQDIEMPLMPALAQMERNGVRVDTQGLRETSLLFTRKMQDIEQEIHRLAGRTFNISSPKQVGELLFDHLRIADNPRRTRRGQYETGEDILEALRHKHPVVEMILSYRGLKKLLGTYVNTLPTLVNPRTGHIHTSFNQTVAQTGRLSSSNPNLQNIPVREEQGKEVRKAFIPDEGQLFFSADYSQIELRLMAHLSQDPNLIADFLAGHDIHTATAAKIFRKSLEEVTPAERRQAKTANFGIIYGISPFGLAERLGCSRAEAKDLIEGYFATYPRLKDYMDESIAKARLKGYSETLFHRRLAHPNISSRNAVVRAYAERNAINAPLQGSAADIIKIATVRIHRRMQSLGLASKMILQVHDELNFTVPPEEKDIMQSLVISEMQGACTLSVPLVADCGWGANWLEAH